VIEIALTLIFRNMVCMNRVKKQENAL